jgi:hypothetical protein
MLLELGPHSDARTGLLVVDHCVLKGAACCLWNFCQHQIESNRKGARPR